MKKATQTFLALIGLVLFQLTSLSFAQEKTSTSNPPATAATTPTQEQTLQAIEDKLNAQGTLTFTAHFLDTKTGDSGPMLLRGEVTEMRHDPDKCTLRYHEKITKDRHIGFNQDTGLLLGNIAQIKLSSEAEFLTASNVSIGHRTAICQDTNPPLVAVKLMFDTAQHYVRFTLQSPADAESFASEFRRAAFFAGLPCRKQIHQSPAARCYPET